LEEFDPITMEDPFTAGDEGEDTDRASSADNPAYNDALLQRALNALGSEHKDLYPYAIEQLADLKDPRATQALIDVALNGAEQTPEVRRRAVAALSRPVEQLGSADMASTNALKQLAQDSDQEVRAIASQALQAIPTAVATGVAITRAKADGELREGAGKGARVAYFFFGHRSKYSIMALSR
jgi:HEAT repeat protein